MATLDRVVFDGDNHLEVLTVQASSELQAVIAGWFEAAASGDVGWRDDHVSRLAGLHIVGTDPTEFLQGDEAYAFLRNEAETVGGRVLVEVGEVEAYEEGTVGWGVARLTITVPDGRKVTPRWATVFRREEHQWRMALLHASVGVPDEVVFGETFTP